MLEFLRPYQDRLHSVRGLARKSWRGFVNACIEWGRVVFFPFKYAGPPVGVFSAYRRLLEGRYEGEVMMPGQEIGFIAPTSMRVVSGLEQDRHQPWPIVWTRHSNARLAGRTLVLVDAEKRGCVEAMYHDHYPTDPAYRTFFLPPPVYLAGKWTSVISQWSMGSSYYHWLMDGLPRLALLDRLPKEISIIVPRDLRPFQRDTLHWLGLEGRYRETSESHLLIEDYFFSSPTSMTGCTNPYAVEFLRRKFMPFKESSPGDSQKIYIARRGKTRGITNEQELISALQEDGWSIVDSESLTLAQQIGLFSNAKKICGAHGAGFTNILWCYPACHVVELMADTYKNGCYEAIAACANLKYSCLIYQADLEDRIVVDVDKLLHHLSE